MYARYIKRILDFTFALLAILCFSPILIVVTVWLHFANKGAGAFFTQERPGKDEKIFRVIKFKSMTDERDEAGELLPDAQRLTKVGRFVRATSIDELPQLLNVLKGDMSFIGPRPWSPDYLPYYNEREHHRHDVRPGISGWAQVNGRAYVRWQDRIAFDLEYVEALSLAFDLKIIWKTLTNLFNRKSVGIEKSGVYSFYDYRKAEWAEQGRQDLIEKAEKEEAEIMRKLKEAHLN